MATLRISAAFSSIAVVARVRLSAKAFHGHKARARKGKYPGASAPGALALNT
jgi:hypothetical protein